MSKRGERRSFKLVRVAGARPYKLVDSTGATAAWSVSLRGIESYVEGTKRDLEKKIALYQASLREAQAELRALNKLYLEEPDDV